MRTLRSHGGSIFFDLDDGTAILQSYIQKHVVGEDSFHQFEELVDIGDFLEIFGTLFLTQKGERTLQVEKYRILTKTLLPLPEKWHGIQDVEERFRKRYLDLIMNP